MKRHRLTDYLAKRLAPSLSALVAGGSRAAMVQKAEAYLAILLGKGAATGWALEAEIAAAQSTIHTETPVLLDIGTKTGEGAAQRSNRNPPPHAFYERFVLSLCHRRVVQHRSRCYMLMPQIAQRHGTIAL